MPPLTALTNPTKLLESADGNSVLFVVTGTQQTVDRFMQLFTNATRLRANVTVLLDSFGVGCGGYLMAQRVTCTNDTAREIAAVNSTTQGEDGMSWDGSSPQVRASATAPHTRCPGLAPGRRLVLWPTTFCELSPFPCLCRTPTGSSTTTARCRSSCRARPCAWCK